MSRRSFTWFNLLVVFSLLANLIPVPSVVRATALDTRVETGLSEAPRGLNETTLSSDPQTVTLAVNASNGDAYYDEIFGMV